MENNSVPSQQDRVTVIIPAYNEGAVIGQVLDNIQAVCGAVIAEIIVIDDGSTDDTAARAKERGVHVIHHNPNRGYGASLKTGIKACQTEWFVTMDADGQHRAEDVLMLLETAQTQEADMVIGQRTGLVHSNLWRMPGKWLLVNLANYLTCRKIPDLNSGLRLVRHSVARRYIHLCPEGFSFSTTITMALLYRRYNVIFKPIQIQKRVGKSTVSVNSGFQTIMLIIRLASLFDPLRVYLPLSFASVLFGILWSIRYLLLGRGVSVASMLAMVTGVMLFSVGLVCDQVSQLRLERYE